MLTKIKPAIALVITDKETNAQIKSSGADVLELRVDLFSSLDLPYIVKQIQQRRLLKIPLLLTVRNQQKEGARKTFADNRKWAIFQESVPLVDMVDIELSSPLLKRVITLACQHHKKIIVSAHDFKRTPDNLESIVTKAKKAGADIVKIASHANTWDDVLAMLLFTHHHRQTPLITMSLGKIGAVSRVLFPAFGSCYTYTFLNKPTASGQIPVQKLKSLLKFCYQ